MRFTQQWFIWLCLSLMLWAAAAESTHSHPNRTENAACSICVVARSTTPATIVNQVAPVFAAIGLLQEEDVIAKARLTVFDLGIRGPPAL